MNEAHIDRLREMREHYDNEAAGAAALEAAISALKKQERHEALLEAARDALDALESMSGDECSALQVNARRRLASIVPALEEK